MLLGNHRKIQTNFGNARTCILVRSETNRLDALYSSDPKTLQSRPVSREQVVWDVSSLSMLRMASSTAFLTSADLFMQSRFQFL